MTSQFSLDDLNTELIQVKNELKQAKRENELLRTSSDRNVSENFPRSEETFRSFVENSHELMFKCDNKGRFTFLNPAWETSIGYKLSEMLGHPFSKFTRAEEIEEDQTEFAYELAGGSTKGYPSTFISKEGKMVNLIFNAFPLKDENGIIIGTQGTAYDITELNRVQNSLQESELKHRLLVQNMPGMVYRAYSDWSAEIFSGCELISGYTREEINLQETKWLSIVHPDDRVKISQMGNQLSQDAKSIIQIYRIIDKQGAIRWVEDRKISFFINGKFKGIDGIVFDITEKKKQEEELQEIEDQYRFLVDSSNLGIIISQDNILKFVNKAFSKMHGYESPDDLIGKHIEVIIAHDERKLLAERGLNRAKGSNEPLAYETIGLRKDGSKFPVSVSVTLINYQDKPTSLVFTEDITEKKRREVKLIESEEKFRNYVETSQDLIWQLDDEGRFIYLNPAWEEALGFSLNEMIGQKFTNFKKPNLIDRDLATFQKNLEGKAPVKDYHTIYISKTGEDVHLNFKAIATKNEKGIIIGTQGSAYNITELNHVQRSLHESERRYRELFEKLPIAVREMDFSGVKKYLQDQKLNLKDLTSTYFYENPEIFKECVRKMRTINANHAALEFFGTSNRKDLKNLESIFTDKTFENFAEILSGIFMGKTSIETETEMIRFDGSKRSIAIRLTIPPAYRKSLVKVLVITRDITESKRFEEEIIKSSKLESIGILAGGIAHDFNNLLTGISGNISLAILASDESNTGEIYLSEAQFAIHQASKLTNQLLIFSKGGVPNLEKLAIGQMLQESVRFTLRGSNVKSNVQIQDDLSIVEVDSSQFGQVIQNVVINGIQAMPEGGVLHVRSVNISIEENQLPGLKRGDYVCITIKDQGDGIAEENIGKIFDPFFTTKASGTGLGLATSYSILQKHNGYITIESEVDIGTTVTIYLPAISESVIATSEESISDKTTVNRKYSSHILIMDDEPIVQNVFKGMFEKMGCTTVVVHDGEAAINVYKAAQKSNQPFDLVVLDLTISGGMGGKETIKQLLYLDTSIKAIVASGYSNDPILANYKEYGFQEKIEKPFTVEILQNILNSINL